MLIKFIGALGRVTGSCSLLKYRETGVEFLVDCGMVQGDIHSEFENNKKWPFNPEDIKFILLTHAHLDHCGLIPRLYDEGFNGKVICTNATAKLAKEVLLDSAKIGNLYTQRTVNKIRFYRPDKDQDFEYGKDIKIDKGIYISFLRSSHILGSVSIGVKWRKNSQEKVILFSGDLGNNTKNNLYQPLLNSFQLPLNKPNYIVLESTYGSKERDIKNKSYDNRINALKEIVFNIIDKKGKLIIPAFSLHRTQQILFDLHYIFEKHREELVEKFIRDRFTRRNLAKYYDDNVLKVLERENTVKIVKCKDYTDKIEKGFTDKSHIDFLVTENEYLTKEEKEILKNAFKENNGRYVFDNNISDNYKDKVLEILRDFKYSTSKDKAVLEKINIYLDSLLGRKATEVYNSELCNSKFNKNGERNLLYRNPLIKNRFNVEDERIVDKKVQKLFPPNATDNKTVDFTAHRIIYGNVNKLKDELPAVIISSSGMCSGGPILEHMYNHLREEDNTLLLIGYQSEHTKGNKLSKLDELSKYEKEVRKFNFDLYKNGTIKKVALKYNDINANIIELKGYYSGHADQSNLVNYIF